MKRKIYCEKLTGISSFSSERVSSKIETNGTNLLLDISKQNWTPMEGKSKEKRGHICIFPDLNRLKELARFVLSISYKLELWALSIRLKVWLYVEHNFIVVVWGLNIGEVQSFLPWASSHSEIEKEREEFRVWGGLHATDGCNPPFHQSIEHYIFFPFGASMS